MLLMAGCALVGEAGKGLGGGWHLLLRRASLALGGGPCRLDPWEGSGEGGAASGAAAAAAAAAACTGEAEEEA